MDFSIDDLSQKLKPYNRVELEQVHGNKILQSSHISLDMETGDGILLDQKDTAAIIKTADCTPLFFWHDSFACGGILHIGWKGLLKDIQLKLLDILQTIPVDIQQLNFYLGPAIKKECYPVGRDLFDLFINKTYHDKIFSPIKNDKEDKYLLDVQRGIIISLIEAGIPKQRISTSQLCTFCEEERLPSYRRRPNSGKRIYNFLVLKSNL